MSVEWWALWISLASFCVALLSAWMVHFRPASLAGTLSHVVTWQFSSWKGEVPSGEVCGRFLTPSIWLGNSGSATAVIEEVRLLFESDAKDFIAYPISKVGLDIVENPGAWSGKAGLGNKGPMPGIAIKGGDEWRNEYAFSAKLKDFERLYGAGVLKVQVKLAKKKGWVTVISEKFNFGVKPYHLEPLSFMGNVCGSMTGYVYSDAWHRRRES